MAGSELPLTYELVIVGGGPAGMTAAVYAARKQMVVALLAEELGGQMTRTWEIENYMGYQFVTGAELTGKFEEHLRRHKIDIRMGEKAMAVTLQGKEFEVRTASGKGYRTKTVIIATGKRPRTMGIPGEDRLRGRGVSYCATCDGPLFKDRDVAVVGGGNSAVSVALEMTRHASKVYVVSRREWKADPVIAEKAKAAENLERLVGYVPAEIRGEKHVESMLVKQVDGSEERELAVKGVFVEIGSDPNSTIVKELVELNPAGEVRVTPRCETSVPGIFAAGDVTDVPEKQIVVAAGEGAKAALAAYEYVSKL